MVNNLLVKARVLNGTSDEIKILYFYRYISLVFTSLFYLIGNFQSPIERKVMVILCLTIASVTLSYLYIKNYNDRNVIKLLIFIEVIGNTLVLIPTGGLNSPYLWYSLNTVLVTVYYFNIIYCSLNLIIYIACSTEISHFIFDKQNKDIGAIRILWNNSNLILSFILITIAVQLLLSLAKKLNKERKTIVEVNNQLVEANERTKKSIEYLMALYQMGYSVINLENKGKLIERVLYYSKKITIARSAFFYQITNKEQGELEVSEEVSEKIKVMIQEKLKEQFGLIVKNSYIPMSLDIDNKKFIVIPVRSQQKIYGILGIEIDRDNKEILLVETISQLKFLSSLISIVLERFELEEINKCLLVSEEQNRIAREIHDSVCQRIFAIGCKIHTLKQKSSSMSFEELKKEFDFIEQSLNKANKELRMTIYDLSWSNGKVTVFQEEIGNYIKDIARLNNIEISFNITGYQEIVENGLKKALYRIICESVGNSARHGRCSKIGVLLSIKRECIELNITDDGVGFDLNNQPKGLGMQNIYNLVYYFNGDINIQSKLGVGTTIHVKFPVNIFISNFKGEVV